MKKYVFGAFMMGVLLMLFSINAFAAEDSYSNGTDVAVTLNGEYYINIDDEDKLYYKETSSHQEVKILDNHVMSIVSDSNGNLYLLVYVNGGTDLVFFNTSTHEHYLLCSFDYVITNMSARKDELYIKTNIGIQHYDLETNALDTLVENSNIDFMYFSNYETLLYYSKSNDNEYDICTYSFNKPKKSSKRISENNSISLMSATSYSPRLTEPSTSNAYYTSLNVFHTSGYGMVDGNGNKRGNCTCYAYGRSYENLGYKPSLCTGNAGTWYSYNANNGFYSYGKTPYLGAVAVWSKAGAAGHVAVVEVINGDTVITSESGWNSFYFKTVTRSASNSNFSAYSSYNFLGFIYVCGTGSVPAPIYTEKPSNCSISSNYYSIGIGDTVSFTYCIDNATNKNIGIDYAGGERYANININSNSGTVDYTFSKPGLYCCIIEGSNNVGYNCSEGVYIRVIDSYPTNCSITSNKTTIYTGDTVTFNYNINGATVKHIGIDYAGGNRFDSISITHDNGTVSYTFQKAGTYCCIVEGYNNLGYNCSAGIYITVSGSVPSNCSIKADKTDIFVGDTVTFSYNINGATVKRIGIDSNNARYDNVGINADSGVAYYTFNEPGAYCCIVEGYNNNGFSCSEGVYINVKQRPTGISANYTSIGVGDTVTFNYSIGGATTYKGIGIDYAGGNRYASFPVNNVTGNVGYTFTEPGLYCCIIEGRTEQNYFCSEGVYVTVIDSAPINCNISANKTNILIGDTVTFNYNITGAPVKCIGIDSNNTRYDNIGINADTGIAYYTFTKPGIYCCIVEGYNNIAYNCSPGVYVTVKESYTVSYHANGGISAPSPQTKIQDESLILSPENLTRPGYIFWGWADNNPNAENATYPAGGTFTGNYSTTLYAVWKPATYNIHFDTAGGTVDTQDKSVTYLSTYGDLPTPTRKGYIFKGWYTSNSGGDCITGDSTVQITANQTLYARWEQAFYTIIYDVNGGENSDWDVSSELDKTISISNIIPTRNGYRFIGWAKVKEAIEADYMPNDTYTENSDIILYAVWKAIPCTETKITKKSAYSLVNVDVSNAEVGNTIIVAAYSNGMMTDIQYEEYNGESLVFAVPNKFDTIKTMVWDSLKSMKPLSVVEVK